MDVSIISNKKILSSIKNGAAVSENRADVFSPFSIMSENDSVECDLFPLLTIENKFREDLKKGEIFLLIKRTNF